MVKSSAAENAEISAAALRCAALSGWEKVTLEMVAKAAKMPVAALKRKFAAPVELVPVIAEQIDREAFSAAGEMSGTAHDVLFDLLMARFDLMQKNRKAILSIGDAARRNRILARALICANLDGVYRVIDQAKLAAPPRPILAIGIAAIYGTAFFAWRKDESRDMAKTMAALDRALRWAEQAMRFHLIGRRYNKK